MMLPVGLRELCSKSSSLFYSEFPHKLYHYAHYYSQDLLIINIILNYTFTAFLHFCNQNVQQYFVVANTIKFIRNSLLQKLLL